MYLLSAFSLNILELPISVRFQEVTIEYVRWHLEQMNFVSAVAHESTAKLLSERLGIEVQFNTIDVQLKRGAEALIAQLPKPKEGQVYSDEEIRNLPLRFVYIYVR